MVNGFYKFLFHIGGFQCSVQPVTFRVSSGPVAVLFLKGFPSDLEVGTSEVPKSSELIGGLSDISHRSLKSDPPATPASSWAITFNLNGVCVV